MEQREEKLRQEFSVREQEIKTELDVIKERMMKRRQDLLDSETSFAAAGEDRLAKLRDEISASERFLNRQKEELDELKKRNEDRRLELERVNEDLKMQIRLIEAKARPDAIFIEAFSLGVSKSWDSITPLITANFDRLKEKIKTDAIEETRKQLEPLLGNKVHTNKS